MARSEKTGKMQAPKTNRAVPLRTGTTGKPKYIMRLFIAGKEPNSMQAQKNIYDICLKHLKGNFRLEVIDVFHDFAPAIEENILVTPALVIDKPVKRKLYGTLQDKEKVLTALELMQ